MTVTKFSVGIICAFVSLTMLAATSRQIAVSNVTELTSAVWNAQSGDVITLAAGTYDLTGTPSGTPGHLYASVSITLKGETDNPEDTVLLGSGGRILYLYATGNVIRNLTFANGDTSAYASQTAVEPRDYGRGGAICFRNSEAGMVSNCVFRSNRGGSMGGGAIGTYTAGNTYNADFYDCVFSNKRRMVTAEPSTWPRTCFAAGSRGIRLRTRPQRVRPYSTPPV